MSVWEEWGEGGIGAVLVLRYFATEIFYLQIHERESRL